MIAPSSASPEDRSSPGLSPITGEAKVMRYDRIAVSEVEQAYAQIGIDVHDHFGNIKFMEVYRCQDTGYRFYFPYSLAAKSEFYTKLQAKMDYYAPWRWEHGEAASFLIKPGLTLEIGTGTGNFLARIKQEFKQEVIGLELNAEALHKARERNLDVQGLSIEEFARDNRERFDTVCSFQVLEHIPEVASFVAAACSTLRPGGKLIIAVPNNNPYYWKYDRLHALNLPPHHMGLWDRSSLAALAQSFSLTVLDIRVEPVDRYLGDIWGAYLRGIERKYPWLHCRLKNMPWRLTLLALAVLKRCVEGPNILAVYEKRSS